MFAHVFTASWFHSFQLESLGSPFRRIATCISITLGSWGLASRTVAPGLGASRDYSGTARPSTPNWPFVPIGAYCTLLAPNACRWCWGNWEYSSHVENNANQNSTHGTIPLEAHLPIVHVGLLTRNQRMGNRTRAHKSQTKPLCFWHHRRLLMVTVPDKCSQPNKDVKSSFSLIKKSQVFRRIHTQTSAEEWTIYNPVLLFFIYGITKLLLVGYWNNLPGWKTFVYCC